MVVFRIHNTCRRVPVDLMFSLQVVFSNVIVGVTISRRSFVFDQSRGKVSTNFTHVSGLAVAAFDLIYCSLSVLGRTYLPMIRTTVWMTTKNFDAIMVSSDRWGSIGLKAITFHRSRPLLFWITLSSLEQWTSAATETFNLYTSTCVTFPGKAIFTGTRVSSRLRYYNWGKRGTTRGLR